MRRRIGIPVPHLPVPGRVRVRRADRGRVPVAVRSDQGPHADDPRLHVADAQGDASHDVDGRVRRVLPRAGAAVGPAGALHDDEVLVVREDAGVPVRERGAEAARPVHAGRAAGAHLHGGLHRRRALRHRVASLRHHRLQAEQGPERVHRRHPIRGRDGGDLARVGGAYHYDRHPHRPAVVRLRCLQGVHGHAAPSSGRYASLSQKEARQITTS